jgi:hypothetical protein
MSGTRRTPIGREPTKGQVTRRTALLWRDMCKLRCLCPRPRTAGQGMCSMCKHSYDLHEELCPELGLEPWQWPCVVRKTPSMAGPSGFPLSDPGGKATLARMAALDEAVASLETEEEKT